MRRITGKSGTAAHAKKGEAAGAGSFRLQPVTGIF
jgi:hypothetical protein